MPFSAIVFSDTLKRAVASKLKQGRAMSGHRLPDRKGEMCRKLAPSFAATISLIAAPLLAQWVNVPSRAPQTKDGKPDLAASVPLAPNGKPDLSGTWAIDVKGFSEDLAEYLRPSELPIQLWAQAVTDERQANGAAGTPTARCLPPGIPMAWVSSIAHPFKIVQQPNLVVILYEYFGEFRQVFLDGRAPPKDPNPTWLGYSVGRWMGILS
jgi:hypothetical protein